VGGAHRKTAIDQCHRCRFEGYIAGTLDSVESAELFQVVQRKVHACLPLRLQVPGYRLRSPDLPGHVGEDKRFPARMVLEQLCQQPARPG
jgi:hypothetical protein